MSQNHPDEYSIVSENIRHEDNIFFANVTVFVSITGALLAFVFAADPNRVIPVRLAAVIGGALVSFVFWMESEISMHRSQHFRKRAAEIDPRTYGTMLEQKKSKFHPGLWGWRLLFGSVAGFWIARSFDDVSFWREDVSLFIAIGLPVCFQLAVHFGSRDDKPAIPLNSEQSSLRPGDTGQYDSASAGSTPKENSA